MKIHTKNVNEAVTNRIFDTETGIVYDYNKTAKRLSVYSVHSGSQLSTLYLGDNAKRVFEIVGHVGEGIYNDV